MEERSRKKGEKTYLYYVLDSLHVLFHFIFIMPYQAVITMPIYEWLAETRLHNLPKVTQLGS